MKSKGFTLIELLVVVAIISLLSSVVMASLRQARDRASYTKFDSEFLQLRNAVTLYRADHDGEYPPSIVSSSLNSEVVQELYDLGYFPASSISEPRGYSFNGNLAEAANSTNAALSTNGTVVTCGSSTVSPGNNYALYFNTYQIGSDTSNLPEFFQDGASYNDAEFSYYCFEI